jgi:hypothetical protein
MRSHRHARWDDIGRDAARVMAEVFGKAGCGFGPGWGWSSFEDAVAGGGGVRARLRLLATRLGLDDAQTRELARILTELRTERDQAEVDHRRMTAALADVLAADTFDAAQAAEAAMIRLHAAERVRQATLRALERLHGCLNAEQRGTLAMLVRTGAVVL